MAEDKTIPQLDDGGTIQVTDMIPVARDGGDVRVVIAPAGTKGVSDPDQDTVASVNGATVAGHVAVFTDEFGTVGDGGELSAIFTNAPRLDLVLTTDDLAVLRGNVIYRASIAAVLSARPPAGTGGQYDFSDPVNSAYAAII
jgi:hypothetical protein